MTESKSKINLLKIKRRPLLLVELDGIRFLDTRFPDHEMLHALLTFLLRLVLPELSEKQEHHFLIDESWTRQKGDCSSRTERGTERRC